MVSDTWNRVAIDLIRCAGTLDLPAALTRACRSACPLDSLIVTEFSPSASPKSMYDDLEPVQATIHISFYEAGPYRFDPFYLAAMRDGLTGAFRLRDLVQDAFYKSEYYRMFFRKIGLSDELGLIVKLDGERAILVSLARKLKQPRFSDTDLASIRTLFPLLEAACQRQWGGSLSESANLEPANFASSFESDLLSPRELEIIRLVLEGHSTPSAAALLGIAEGTVKVHRRHAYAKLAVSSQGELFSRAARLMATQTN